VDESVNGRIAVDDFRFMNDDPSTTVVFDAYLQE